MYHSKLKTSNTLVVLLILILSLSTRLIFSSTHISFGQDVARDSWLMSQRIKFDQIIVDYGPKVGIGNFYLPPLYYQIHLIFSLLTDNDPLVMKWVVTVFEALSPVLLFLIIKDLFGIKLATLSSLLYIVAPIPLQYGTTAWNPNMIPFFSLLMVYSFIRVVKNRQLWFIPIACFSFIVAFQFHYQASVLLPLLAFCFIYSIKNNFSQRLLLFWASGIIIMSLILLPYFYAEITSNFSNSRAILTYFSQEHSRYFERISKPTYVFTYFPAFFDRVLFGKETLYSIFGLSIYFGGIFSLIAHYRKTKNLSLLIILFYFFSIFIMLRVFRGDKLDYFFSTLFFLPFVFLASLMSAIRSKFVILSIFGLMFFSSGIYISQWHSYNDLAELQSTIEFIQAKSPAQNIRFIFHDDDFINNVFFGIQQYSTLTIDQTATAVVDICNNREICAWDNFLACRHSLAYSKVALFKLDSQYQQQSHRFGKVPFQVIIGTIGNSDATLDTTGYIYQGESGSDFLIE